MTEVDTLAALNEIAAHTPLAALNEALAMAQGEFPPIPRDKEVKTVTYSFRYAELGSILAAVRPVLSKHGLAIIQPLEAGGIRTELRHRDGGVLTSWFPFPGDPPAAPQALGSLITYLRRYCLVSLLGIASDDDDAAGHASAEVTPPSVQAAAKKRITAAQRKRLFAIAQEHGVDEPRLRGYVNYYTGQESTEGITAETYDQIVKAVETDGEIPF